MLFNEKERNNLRNKCLNGLHFESVVNNKLSRWTNDIQYRQFLLIDNNRVDAINDGYCLLIDRTDSSFIRKRASKNTFCANNLITEGVFMYM